MKQFAQLCALAFLITLTACNTQDLAKHFIPKKEEAQARSYVEDLRAHKFAPVKAALNPMYIPNADAAFSRMIAIMPSGKPISVKVVGSYIASSPDSTRYSFSWEYEFPGKWILAQVEMIKTGNRLQIETLQFTPMASSLEQMNAFTLRGKGWQHYLVLLAAIVLPLFSIVTLVACWRTPIPKRKWLWMLFIAIGFVQLSLNWTTGNLQFNPLTFVLLSAGYSQQFYGPAVINLALPVGALLFWWMRPKWRGIQGEPPDFP